MVGRLRNGIGPVSVVAAVAALAIAPRTIIPLLGAALVLYAVGMTP
jgi:hypothetical protein